MLKLNSAQSCSSPPSACFKVIIWFNKALEVRRYCDGSREWQKWLCTGLWGLVGLFFVFVFRIEKPKWSFLAKEYRSCSVSLLPHILHFYSILICCCISTHLWWGIKETLKEKENHKPVKKTLWVFTYFLSDGSFGNWINTWLTSVNSWAPAAYANPTYPSSHLLLQLSTLPGGTVLLD